MSVTDLLPIVAIVAVMYLLLWRPQQQEREKQEAFLASLSKDDRVVTIGGLHGRVAEVHPSTVVLELAAQCLVTVEKSAVARRAQAES